jgi:membrane protein YdbS with pleckstrin-like domain
MHCTNCGTYMAAGTRFCAGCGAPAADPEATRYAGAPPPQPYQPQPYVAPPVMPPPPAAYPPVQRYERTSDVEREVFKVRPTLFFIKIGYGLAALGAIIVVVLLAYTSLPTWISVLLALALLLIPAYYHVKRNLVEYKLTNHKIEIDEGFIARTTRNLPLRNIQDVTVSSSIVQRILGYGNVVIDNASEVGGTTVMRNIHDPRKYADLLLRELRRFH